MKTYSTLAQKVLTGLIAGVVLLGAATSHAATARTSTGSGVWATSGTWSPSGTPAAGDTLTILAGHVITVGANVTVATTIDCSGTLTLSTFNFTATSITVKNGGSVTSTGGTKTIGDITVESAGNWNMASSSAITYSGNIANDGTFTESGSGLRTFSGAAKTISGSAPITISIASVTGTYTVASGTTLNLGSANPSLTIGTGASVNNLGTVVLVNPSGNNCLTGLGSFINGATGTLTLGGNGGNQDATITTLDCTAVGNTVNCGLAKLPKAGPFYNLTFNNAVSYTPASVTVNGALIVNGAGITLGASTLTLNGTLTITAGTFSGTAGSSGIVVGGNAANLSLPAIALGTLTVNRANGVTLAGAVTGVTTLNLTSGTLNNSSFGLSLGTTAAITRDTGSLSAAPTFGTSANLTYSGSTSANTGNEMPTSASVLGTLAINNTSAGGITLGANITANGAVTVATACKLNVPTTMTVKSTVAMAGTGLLAVSGTGMLKNSGSSVFTSSATTLTFASGAKFQHAATAPGTVPTAGWDANSTLEILNAIGATPPSGLAQSFGNVTWDSPQSASCNLAGVNLLNIVGTFTVKNTGSFQLQLGVAQSPTISWGNLVVQGGTLVTSSSSGLPTINVSGNITFSGGTLTIVNAAPLNVAGNWTKDSGTFIPGTGTVIFNGASAQSIGGAAATTFNGLNLNNAAGASLSQNETISGTLTLTSGSFAVGANTLTLNGSAIAGTPGNLTTTSSSSFVIGGSSAGVNVPSSVTALNNLTINNTDAGGVALNSSPTLAGTLTVGALALLDFNSQTLTTVATPSLGGTLKMEVSKTGPSTFTGSKLIRTGGLLTYGGALTVMASGSALTGGDKIDLFDASSFASSFSGGITYPTYTLQSGENWSAADLTADGSIMINRAPAVNSGLGFPVLVSHIATLQAFKLGTDPDSQTLSVTAASVTGSGAVTFTSSGITYTAPAAAGSDTINFTVSDGHGGSVSGTVAVTINAENAGSSLTIANVGGLATLNGSGMPSQTYDVQYSDDSGNTWTTTEDSPVTAASNGVVYYQDQDPIANHTSRMYRLKQP